MYSTGKPFTRKVSYRNRSRIPSAATIRSVSSGRMPQREALFAWALVSFFSASAAPFTEKESSISIQIHIDIVSTMPYYTTMTIFKWHAEKNEILAKERGITFEEIVQRIGSGAKVTEVDHTNKNKYPNQKIMIIDVDGYAYLVPFVIDKNEYFLKTIIPSRKATKKYLGGKNG